MGTDFLLRVMKSFGTGDEGASQVAIAVKNPPASAGDIRDQVQSLSREDPLEESSTTHFSTLAWRIPSAEEPDAMILVFLILIFKLTFSLFFFLFNLFFY